MQKATTKQKKSIIRLESVERVFKVGGKEISAVRGVDLEIARGDFIVIFGPSGSGKSTLLNILTGIDKPSIGDVFLDGHHFSAMPSAKRAFVRSRNFGIIYQMAWWVRSLNVLENVALPLYIAGAGEKEANEQAREALTRFGVSELAEQLPTQLSGGEQQLAELARAMVNNPAIIVADEPTGNLDSAASDIVMGYFDKINKETNKTIILVTHNSAYWELGNKRAEMKDGKIIKIKAIK